MQDYTKLVVWRRARAFTVSVHEASRSFPRRVPGLRGQLMRATMSIGANIAEGASRESRRDFARFVTIAAGSASEAEHHLIVAEDLRLLDVVVARRLCGQAGDLRRMLFGLKRALLARDCEQQQAPGDLPPGNAE